MENKIKIPGPGNILEFDQIRKGPGNILPVKKIHLEQKSLCINIMAVEENFDYRKI